MKKYKYTPMNNEPLDSNRRDFVKTLGTGSVTAGGMVLGVPAFGQEKSSPPKVETNIDDFMTRKSPVIAWFSRTTTTSTR